VTGDMVPYYRSRVVGLLELQGDFEDRPDGTPGQYGQIIKFLRFWRVQRACVDATSMGDPVFERLTVLASEIEFEAIHFSAPMKSDMFKHYLAEWESNRLKVASGGKSQELPEHQHFYDQHKNLEKSWSGQYLVCHAPESSTRRLAGQVSAEYHDDYPVSAALAAWAAKSDLLGEIHVDTPAKPLVRQMAHQHQGYAYASKQQRYGRRR
jgi:hypothetical protein